MPPAIPLATYRLQLTADFDFDKAAAVVPYLKSLGITHLYASPVMKARKGSTHGYDTVDHSQFNPELGGEAGFARLSEALGRNDLGLIIDFVPNHVGVHFADNPWWLDVLEWGPTSPHAAAFDIDWDLLPHRARGGVLLPILGSSYGEALERGDIELRYDAGEGSLSAWYFEHRLPIAPERYGEMLRMFVKEADAAETEAGKRLLALAARYTGLRRPNRKEAPGFKAELKEIAGAADIIASGLSAYRAAKDRPAQTLALHHLLERQHYKLGHWRLASSDINYRRFFDVNGLAGLRVEDPGTFAATHRLVKQLVADGRLHGIRLDHIDGLRDPAQYCQRLRRLVRDAQGNTKPFYTVIEKILCEHEHLPHFAGIQGTTGYEWMNVITQVLVDAKGLEALDETWRQVSNRPPRLAPYVKEAKRRVLETLLTSEFIVLTRLLARIANGHYSTRDFSADSLRQALELYVLHFPVYRTYLTSGAPAAHDRKLIDDTIARARAEWFAADEGIFDFLRDALTMDLLKPGRPPHSAPRVRRFALKVQQFTGPVMAKSLEDTAFYQFHRLLAAERGRRRSREHRPCHSRLPRGHARARQGMAARDDGNRHPRHQARRGRPRPDCSAQRNSWRMDQRSFTLESAERAASRTPRPSARPVGDVRIHALPDPARRLAASDTRGRRLRRAYPGLCAEGRPRGQGRDELAQPARDLRDRTTRLRREDPRSRAVARIPGGAANPGAPRRAARRVELAEPAHPQGNAAGRS
ncbi:malto-oligosyltrehalose synthase [Bradyrhizobium japonicum]